MEEHFIIFIDFLGFKEAVEANNIDKINSLILLLKDLSSLQADFDYQEEPLSEGATRSTVRPNITTFSDHIVMSYPLSFIRRIEGIGKNGFGTILSWSSMELIGRIAAEAMKLGLLIRGGITVGPLHHSKGVVLGSAMNEAHKLESKVSLYPRITVSRKIYSEVKTQPRKSLLLQDDDGITHLNYFEQMIRCGGYPTGDNYILNLNRWIRETELIINQNIELFERLEDWAKLAKWVWFKTRYAEAKLNSRPLIEMFKQG
jgi:hypothetical protein